MIGDHRTEVWAERSIIRQKIQLYLVQRIDADRIAVAQPVVFDTYQGNERYATRDPTIELYFEEAQMLMDELWRVGLRPTEGTGSTGSLAATERHLKDMQALTFRLLDRVHP